MTEEVKHRVGGEHRRSMHRQPEDEPNHASLPFGETLLFTVLGIIFVALAILLNSAVRETFYYFRDVLSK